MVVKTHGSSLRQGEPDLYVCWPHNGLGVFVVIEMKTPGERPRPLQYSKLRKWERAGAIALWSDNPEELVGLIESEISFRERGTTSLVNFRPAEEQK